MDQIKCISDDFNILLLAVFAQCINQLPQTKIEVLGSIVDFLSGVGRYNKQTVQRGFIGGTMATPSWAICLTRADA